MRINKFIAQATGLSRRAADLAITQRRVTVNGLVASTGQEVTIKDEVSLDGKPLSSAASKTTYILHKPVGYVCSRNGQGSHTIYELLPPELHYLKPVGRLDKDSSGLLLLTNDGELAHHLTHPSFQKVKVYEIKLDVPLQPLHQQMISDNGIALDDGPSRLMLESMDDERQEWRVTMHEGRNRQIRRTFAAIGYHVVGLHRVKFGNYDLGNLKKGAFTPVQSGKTMS